MYVTESVTECATKCVTESVAECGTECVTVRYRERYGVRYGVRSGVGDQKGPSIFLVSKYTNKQNVLIPNMVLKIVYFFSIKEFMSIYVPIFDNLIKKIKIIFLMGFVLFF